MNEWLEVPQEVGSVLKEICGDNEVYYYLVGPFFVYTNDYDFFQIRPYKFCFDNKIEVATEEERKNFIEELRKNHLIYDEETKLVNREYEDHVFKVTISAKPGMNIEDIIQNLNSKLENPLDIYNMKFERIK